MAYTNAWDDTKPIDASDADLLGADIRALSLNVHERMSTICVDFLADPIDLKPAYKGNVTARTLMIGPQILQPDGASGAFQQHQSTFDAYQATNGVFNFGAIIIPVGYTITLFEAFSDVGYNPSTHVDNPTTNNTFQLQGINAATGAVVLDTGVLVSSAATGVRQLIASAALNYQVTANDKFAVKFISINAGGFCFGFRITINKDDNTQGY